MSFIELIPQVFYDAIARVVAGLILVASVVVIWLPCLEPSGESRALWLDAFCGAPVTVSMAMIVVAYVLALVVEGIRCASEGLRERLARLLHFSTHLRRQDEQWDESWRDFSNAYPRWCGAKPARPEDAIVIDHIRMLNASVGARIVKLRAEVALCCTLAMGWGILLVLLFLCWLTRYESPQGHPFSYHAGFAALGLLAGSSAMAVRGVTIDDRHLRALYDHWLMLVDPGLPQFASEARVAVADRVVELGAFLARRKIIDKDAEIKGGTGYRKLLVTKLYETSEKLATHMEWKPPEPGEKCEVVRTGNLEIGVFSERAPQDRHCHKSATETYCVLKGKMGIELDGGIHHLDLGDILVINPGTPHMVLKETGPFLGAAIKTNCSGENDKLPCPPKGG